MNSKKTILAIIAVAVLWYLMDFIIHGNLLTQAYQDTANLWRPPAEMNLLASLCMTFIMSIIFVLFYSAISSVRSVVQGFKFGFWYGLASGLGMFGMTLYMPIPSNIGIAWFFACLVESVILGTVLGYITKA